MSIQHYVYVQAKDGKPLMPTTRCGKVRRMLDEGLAKPVRTRPFTIRLTYDPKTKVRQHIRLGMDPGRTNIGLPLYAGTGNACTALFVSPGTKKSRSSWQSAGSTGTLHAAASALPANVSRNAWALRSNISWSAGSPGTGRGRSP